MTSFALALPQSDSDDDLCNSSASDDKTIIANDESLLLDTDTEDGKLLTMIPIMIKVRMVNISLHDVDALSRYTQIKFLRSSKSYIKKETTTHTIVISIITCVYTYT